MNDTDDIEVRDGSLYYKHLKLYDNCHFKTDSTRIISLINIVRNNILYIDILATICRSGARTELTVIKPGRVILDIYNGSGYLELCLLLPDHAPDLLLCIMLHSSRGIIFGSKILSHIISDPSSISNAKAIVDEFINDSEAFIAKYAE